MRELEQFLNVEAEWVFDRLSECGFDKGSGADRAYYQGRLDQLAQVRRYLGQPQIMREHGQVMCGDCLRSDCYHLEEARA
jgi:hypothetical protein